MADHHITSLRMHQIYAMFRTLDYSGYHLVSCYLVVVLILFSLYIQLPYPVFRRYLTVVVRSVADLLMAWGYNNSGRFKHWPVASEIIGGPSSLTYDWPVRPADIFILDLRKNVLLVWKLMPGFIFILHFRKWHWYRSSCSTAVLLPIVKWSRLIQQNVKLRLTGRTSTKICAPHTKNWPRSLDIGGRQCTCNFPRIGEVVLFCGSERFFCYVVVGNIHQGIMLHLPVAPKHWRSQLHSELAA